MTRDSFDERLWRSVKPVLSAAKDERGRVKGLGTAFVCGQDGTTSYLLTCWHVVDTIGKEHLRVMGREAKVVALGDKALDLALLEVDGLPETESLALATTGYAAQQFRTVGHFWADEKEQDVADSRRLDGHLGEKRRKFSDRYGAVAGWEFSVVKDDAFDRIRAGYSGAPVLDTESGLVVAVVSHQEGDIHGHAVDVSNLTAIYPAAEAFFDASGGDEGVGRDPWIVKTLDHVKQARPLRDQLGALGAPAVAVVEGSTDDLPNFLADDVFLDPWPSIDQIPQDATTLNPARYGEDENAFWSAVHHCLPAPQQAAERAREREAVLAWLRERDRHLFYLSLSMVDDGFLHLPRWIRAAQGFLAELSRREPGMHLLILIACQPRREKPPWWWPLWRGFCRRRLPGVLWLDPLRPLERTDINAWYDGFSGEARSKLYRGRLRDELLDLFEEGHVGIRYRLARRCLLEGGALQRARIGR